MFGIRSHQDTSDNARQPLLAGQGKLVKPISQDKAKKLHAEMYALKAQDPANFDYRTALCHRITNPNSKPLDDNRSSEAIMKVHTKQSALSCVVQRLKDSYSQWTDVVKYHTIKSMTPEKSRDGSLDGDAVCFLHNLNKFLRAVKKNPELALPENFWQDLRDKLHQQNHSLGDNDSALVKLKEHMKHTGIEFRTIPEMLTKSSSVKMDNGNILNTLFPRPIQASQNAKTK